MNLIIKDSSLTTYLGVNMDIYYSPMRSFHVETWISLPPEIGANWSLGPQRTKFDFLTYMSEKLNTFSSLNRRVLLILLFLSPLVDTIDIHIDKLSYYSFRLHSSLINGYIGTSTISSVQDYYGKVLSTQKDLKTSACTSCCAPPVALGKIMSQINDEVMIKFYGKKRAFLDSSHTASCASIC